MRLLPAILAMTAVVVASNILVQVPIGAWLTLGALTYPFAFLVTDLVNRRDGPAAARRVVLWGFGAGILCSVAASFLETPGGNPLTTPRIATGSAVAFLVAQLLDIAVFDRLRRGSWWRAPLVSSLVASVPDTALFFAIAFSASFAFLDAADPNGWARETVPLLGAGPPAPVWVSLALADYGAKAAVALVALGPFRLLLRSRG